MTNENKQLKLYQLIEYLEQLESQGKGDYDIYGGFEPLYFETIEVDDKLKEIILA